MTSGPTSNSPTCWLRESNRPRRSATTRRRWRSVRGSPWGTSKLGMELVSTGRTEEAVEPLRRAVDLEPKALTNHLWLAVALSRSGRHDGAIEHLRAAIGRNPNEPGLHSTLGNFLEYAGRYAEALPHYRQAVALAPNDTVDQNRLRALLVRLGRGDEARVAWRRSLEADPPGHDAWYGYAEFSLFLGQEDEYRRARRDVLARFGATDRPARRGAGRPGVSAPARDGGRAAPGRGPRRAGRGRRRAGRGRRAVEGFGGLSPIRVHPGPGRIPSGAARSGDRVDARGGGEALLSCPPASSSPWPCTAAGRRRKPGKRSRRPSWPTIGGPIA